VFSLNPFRTCIGVFEEKNFFTGEEIKKIRDLKSTLVMDNAKVLRHTENGRNPDDGKLDNTIRKSEIGWIPGNEHTQWLYAKVVDKVTQINQQYFGFSLTDIELMQYAVYPEGGHYDKHIDTLPPGPGCTVRKLTFTIQLCEGESYQGGDFVTYTNDPGMSWSRDAGTMLVLPTYQLHQILPVTQGTREALVGWMHGPSFV
jgi:PKHD-type hydroxylase